MCDISSFAETFLLFWLSLSNRKKLKFMAKSEQALLIGQVKGSHQYQ